MIRLTETVNLASQDVYEELLKLAYKCRLASNDFHHMHLNAVGEKFNEIHTRSDDFYYRFNRLSDMFFELAKENGMYIENESHAIEIVKDWTPHNEESYEYEQFLINSEKIMSAMVNDISAIQNMSGVTSDIQSELDNVKRDLTREVNYFTTSTLDIRHRTVS